MLKRMPEKPMVKRYLLEVSYNVVSGASELGLYLRAIIITIYWGGVKMIQSNHDHALVSQDKHISNLPALILR